MEQEILIIYPSGKKQDADLIKGGLYIPKRGGPIRIFQSIEEATKTGCIVYDRRAYCVRCGDETHFLEGKTTARPVTTP